MKVGSKVKFAFPHPEDEEMKVIWEVTSINPSVVSIRSSDGRVAVVAKFFLKEVN